jgi:hypothetical protein
LLIGIYPFYENWSTETFERRSQGSGMFEIEICKSTRIQRQYLILGSLWGSSFQKMPSRAFVMLKFSEVKKP